MYSDITMHNNRVHAHYPKPISKAEQANATSQINVGCPERMVSVLGGGILALYGLTRRSLPGLGLAALGGGLLYRGITGHCHAYQLLNINTADHLDGPVASIPAGKGIKIE